MMRILLVEDQKESLDVMVLMLKMLGHKVLAAGSVRDALDLAARNPIDLLVCDIVLPDGKGWDIMRRLGAELRIKGIAVSGYGAPEDRRRSSEAGFQLHLLKPVGFDDFESAIRQVAAG